jgi:D-arabinose 1-dehydrogenase-like Zn-dependent alcohol dehydrogenase
MYGSTMGNTKEFEQMIDFVGSTQLEPVVDSIWKPAEGQAAFDHMQASKQFGKIVVSFT